MGYYTYVHGRLEVKPSIYDALSKDRDAVDFLGGGDSDLMYVRTDGEAETVGVLPDGTIGVLGGADQTDVFECRHDDRFKAYHLDSEVMRLCALAKKHGAKVNGCLYLDGEESSDFSRLRVEDNYMHAETPVLKWPNGDVTPMGA